jgi:DNA-binding LytR/AlgR family response regulator
MRCIAIDDEPLALKQIDTYISKVPYLEKVALCHSAAEAAKVLSSESVDLMYVDINMPDLTGMDFVKSLSSPPMVVFTTAYSEYALEGFKVDAIDYLLKPFGFDDFQRSAAKAKKLYDQANAVSAISAPTDDALFFKTDYKVVRVPMDKIVFVEGMSEYLKIHIEGEKDPVVVLLSMKKLQERLPSDKFMRIHKSYIISLSMIREVTKGRVVVNGGYTIPIGDMYKDEFNAYLDSKFLGR